MTALAYEERAPETCPYKTAEILCKVKYGVRRQTDYYRVVLDCFDVNRKYLGAISGETCFSVGLPFPYSGDSSGDLVWPSEAKKVRERFEAGLRKEIQANIGKDAEKAARQEIRKQLREKRNDMTLWDWVCLFWYRPRIAARAIWLLLST